VAGMHVMIIVGAEGGGFWCKAGGRRREPEMLLLNPTKGFRLCPAGLD
jgi:hypothetical protein